MVMMMFILANLIHLLGGFFKQMAVQTIVLFFFYKYLQRWFHIFVFHK